MTIIIITLGGPGRGRVLMIATPLIGWETLWAHAYPVVQSAGLGRIRQSGGGRKIKEIEDPTLLGDLRRLVEPVTRGDPMRVILWTARSLRNLVKELRKLGHKVSPMTVGKLLRGIDYSLQANSKTIEGKQHIDRDAQFQYIDDQAKVFLKARQPVIFCDTKKKELITLKIMAASGDPKDVLNLSTFMTLWIPS
jgi:hypothetical protein